MTKSWRGDKRTTTERGYGWEWQKARGRFLEAHPLCAMCLALNPPKIVAATVVDHKTPHHGDQALFWAQSNWQSLCARHHNSDKQAFEKTGRVMQRIGLDGYPVSGPGCDDATSPLPPTHPKV